MPVLALEEIEAPEDFTAQQKIQWDFALKHAPPGLLRSLDRSVLKAWVIAGDLHRQAAAKVHELGIIVRTPQGQPMTNPYVSVLNKQATIMLRAAAELGFSPSARSRVSVENPHAPVASDPFGDLKELPVPGNPTARR